MNETMPLAGSEKSKGEILDQLDAEIARDAARMEVSESMASEPDYGRTLPRLYFDFMKIVSDPRCMQFDTGQRALYHSFLFIIATSPGAKFPWHNKPSAVARALNAPGEDVQKMLDVALEFELLNNENGNLTSPTVTEAFRDGVKKSFTYAKSGKKGGNTPKKKRPKVPG